MNKEAYNRAQEIDCELSRLKPLQDHIEKMPNAYDLHFGMTYCTDQGLKRAVRTYVNNRIAELEKEFNEL